MTDSIRGSDVSNSEDNFLGYGALSDVGGASLKPMSKNSQNRFLIVTASRKTRLK